MATLYVHIGLPKTGTTTLQKHIFSDLESFEYQGVYQPRRSKKAGEIYQAAISLFNSDINDFEIIEGAKVLNEKYGRRKVLISEEMFCVGIDWANKLRKLSIFVREFDDYKVILTVRDPVKASFSFYIEAYEALSKKGSRSYIDLIRSSQHMKIYHYGYLINLLDDYFGKDAVSVVKFEEVFLANDLSSLSYIFDQSFAFDVFFDENKKDKKEGFILTNRGSMVAPLKDEDIILAEKILRSVDYDSKLKR